MERGEWKLLQGEEGGWEFFHRQRELRVGNVHEMLMVLNDMEEKVRELEREMDFRRSMYEKIITSLKSEGVSDGD